MYATVVRDEPREDSNTPKKTVRLIRPPLHMWGRPKNCGSSGRLLESACAIIRKTRLFYNFCQQTNMMSIHYRLHVDSRSTYYPTTPTNGRTYIDHIPPPYRRIVVSQLAICRSRIDKKSPPYRRTAGPLSTRSRSHVDTTSTYTSTYCRFPPLCITSTPHRPYVDHIVVSCRPHTDTAPAPHRPEANPVITQFGMPKYL